ncbi:hypothetical protein ACFOYW_06060 [Gryllotalpicola reticulitermitis]|uniref:TniQ protein n=1 Tax=Gryllotalpicola reticulitermitis TaxID=1184153 RepID=A0ABV8Q5J6_9MICO
MGLRHVVANQNNRGPLGGRPPQQLTAAEIEVVTCLIAADRALATRHRLIDDLGDLCERHGWARIIVELELMVYGQDGALSHLPLEAGMTSAAVIERLGSKLAFSSKRRARRVLLPGRPCPVCSELRSNIILCVLAPHCYERARIANEFTLTRWWLDQTERNWRAHVCPICAKEDAAGHEQYLCRRHLAARLRQADCERRSIVGYLEGMREELVELTRTYLLCRTVADPDAAASTSFAALGWLHGWDFPLALAGTTGARSLQETL